MWVWWWSTALAHQPGLSYARIDGDAVTLTFSQREIGGYVELAHPDAIDAVRAFTVGRMAVSSPGGPCDVTPGTVQAVENDGLEATATLICPPGDPRTLDAGYLVDFGSDHRHLVEAHGLPVATLDPTAHITAYEAAPGAFDVGLRFVGLGVEHILTGYDHLAFVAGLLLGARRARDLFWLVTTFTVAHSITLALATLDVVRAPGDVVEPLIAASIAFVGLENLLDPPLRRRLALTFTFGLIHGLGFAGLLAELGLPRASRAISLVSFNVGVEAGQLGVVGIALLAWTPIARREAWDGPLRRGLSLLVAAAGVYWLAERVGVFGG